MLLSKSAATAPIGDYQVIACLTVKALTQILKILEIFLIL
jgi:hypothetical protein